MTSLQPCMASLQPQPASPADLASDPQLQPLAMQTSKLQPSRCGPPLMPSPATLLPPTPTCPALTATLVMALTLVSAPPEYGDMLWVQREKGSL
uniref:Uncharacterized protein n=1 Tax=Cannabis sativa TaxID=3483 RepID=A0A803QJH2_CANSA